MSSELPSENQQRFDASSVIRRPRQHHPEPTGIALQTVKTPSALEAAKAIKSTFFATLHNSLFQPLGDPTDQCLIKYSTYFYKNLKLQEHSINDDYLPTNLKNFGLTLQTLDTVKDSSDFKALQRQMAADLDTFKREMTTKYILGSDKITVDALRLIFQQSFCQLLFTAAQGFIALTGITHYTEHEAVMDVLATTPGILITDPYASDLEQFLRLYKATNSLHHLPSPTIEHNTLRDVLIGINGTRRNPSPVVPTDTPTDTPHPDNNNETTALSTNADVEANNKVTPIENGNINLFPDSPNNQVKASVSVTTAIVSELPPSIIPTTITNTNAPHTTNNNLSATLQQLPPHLITAITNNTSTSNPTVRNPYATKIPPILTNAITTSSTNSALQALRNLQAFSDPTIETTLVPPGLPPPGPQPTNLFSRLPPLPRTIPNTRTVINPYLTKSPHPAITFLNTPKPLANDYTNALSHLNETTTTTTSTITTNSTLSKTINSTLPSTNTFPFALDDAEWTTTPLHLLSHPDYTTAPTRTQVLNLLSNFVMNAVTLPLQRFVSVHHDKAATKRVQLATIPTKLSSTADRITAVINAEPPIQLPVLNGIIADHTAKHTDDLRRELQSMKSLLNNATQKMKNAKRKFENAKQTSQQAGPQAQKRYTPTTNAPNHAKKVNGSFGNLHWSRTHSNAATNNNSYPHHQTIPPRSNTHAVQPNATTAGKRNSKRTHSKSRSKKNKLKTTPTL